MTMERPLLMVASNGAGVPTTRVSPQQSHGWGLAQRRFGFGIGFGVVY